MKYIYSAFICLSVFISCKKNNANSFYNIINDNFLNFTDTVAYQHGTFFLIPGDTTLKGIKKDKLLVAVDTSFNQSSRIEKSLSIELEKRNLIKYRDLTFTKKEFAFKTIELSKIKKIGKYSLTPLIKSQKQTNNAFVGQISFFSPYIGEDNAIIIFTIQSSPKAGVTNAFLMNNKSNKWQIAEVIELERW